MARLLGPAPALFSAWKTAQTTACLRHRHYNNTRSMAESSVSRQGKRKRSWTGKGTLFFFFVSRLTASRMQGSGTNKKKRSRAQCLSQIHENFQKMRPKKKHTEHREDWSSSDAFGEMVIKMRTIWILTTSLSRKRSYMKYLFLARCSSSIVQ